MTTATETTLQTRLAQVRGRIATAAQRSGRAPEDITLLAVSKTHPASAVCEAIELGVTDFGENRVQEAEAKIPQVGSASAHWHLIGHLQTNKARRAVSLFNTIHSLDSISLAQRLERACVEAGREDLPVLIQVDLAGEPTKSGTTVTDLPALVDVVKDCSHLKLTGMMVLPPFLEAPEDVRPFFRQLRELRDQLAVKGAFGTATGELSMGMTHDFEVAIEEGATIIRVGTAIFGEREPTKN